MERRAGAARSRRGSVLPGRRRLADHAGAADRHGELVQRVVAAVAHEHVVRHVHALRAVLVVVAAAARVRHILQVAHRVGRLRALQHLDPTRDPALVLVDADADRADRLVHHLGEVHRERGVVRRGRRRRRDGASHR